MDSKFWFSNKFILVIFLKNYSAYNKPHHSYNKYWGYINEVMEKDKL